MKLIQLLSLAAFSTAFVILDQETNDQLVFEPRNSGPRPDDDTLENLSLKDLKSTLSGAFSSGKNAIDEAVGIASDNVDKAKKTFQCHDTMTGYDVQGWLDSAVDLTEKEVHEVESSASRSLFSHDRPPQGPPHDKPPHGPDGHHGHGHHEPNLTVYQLIAESKYTTILAKLINDDEDLVKLLNSTAANYTVFAPTDAAFKKFGKPHKKPSKELIRKVLSYHISGEFYPAGRVLASHTIPSLLKEEALGGESQRLRVGLWLNGLTVNFYSRIVAVNIFGTNGVIHGVDSLILPPIETLKILDLLPGDFSTLQLGLFKTGLFDELKGVTNTGGTFFAPSNFAFQKLGPKINAFLFSSYGKKYLKALLKYHVVANQTLYTDAFYGGDNAGAEGIPKGKFHVDLPTLLEDRSLSIDIVRFGGFISVRINGFTSVAIQDGIAKDGVLQVVRDVIIPPKQPGSQVSSTEELTVEDLRERLEPFVGEGLEL
ncbi:MAG: hypothetical protein M1825_002557 [Sarcosagium campestre]|nr:MAG: hypothetical protein M1825_002557 [Sarcosagium campestre]